jgi:hypothetical protein
MNGIQDIYPLSHLQCGLLFQTLYEPNQQVYISQSRFSLKGQLLAPCLQESFQRAINRHDILRTCFLWEGLPEPVQIVQRFAPLRWEEHDWRGRPANSRKSALDIFAEDDRKRGFDLTRAPLMRLTLIRISEDETELIWTWHHILIDGWSVAQLLTELIGEYQVIATGEINAINISRRPYRDYIAWLAGQNLDVAKTYWQSRLSGITSPTPFPLRSAGRQEAGFTWQQYKLSEEETQRLSDAARRHRLTINTIAQAAWALLISYYANTLDVVFGAVVSGRPAALQGAETMLGLFINTLPVRVKIQPDRKIIDWLTDLQYQQVESRQFDYCPLSEIHGWSEIPRGVSLFDTIFVFENFPIPRSRATLENTTLQITGQDSVSYTSYPLTVTVGIGSELQIRISHRRNSGYSEREIQYMGRQLLEILTSMARDFEGGVGNLTRAIEQAVDKEAETERKRIAEARSFITSQLRHEVSDYGERSGQ